MFLNAKKFIRLHPEWSDERVADTIGCPHILIDDIIAPARREIDADAG